ncbi:hypothetical protein D3C72_1017470 [compost metagenome]
MDLAIRVRGFVTLLDRPNATTSTITSKIPLTSSIVSLIQVSFAYNSRSGTTAMIVQF